MRAPSAKRTLDLAGSLLLLVVLAPLLAAAAAVVAFTSPGGVLLRQTRAGLNGAPFELLKFRTVTRTTSRTMSHAVSPTTPAGRLLRRFSLDELPQLINVVRGEMSLVGPRPLPVADAGHRGAARGRLIVPPGITGLWQVNRHPEMPWNEMVLVDLEYVDRHWLGLDLAILARTLPTVLTPRPARTTHTAHPAH
ncbi:sugar transferase [Streptomyces sp. NPDC091272]|uniref:sugar transferase n=1 Tax=Streptomyces sp. NPDC091272 TaxID=3365981 RepID=UPI003808A1E9